MSLIHCVWADALVNAVALSSCAHTVPNVTSPSRWKRGVDDDDDDDEYWQISGLPLSTDTYENN